MEGLLASSQTSESKAKKKAESDWCNKEREAIEVQGEENCTDKTGPAIQNRFAYMHNINHNFVIYFLSSYLALVYVRLWPTSNNGKGYSSRLWLGRPGNAHTRWQEDGPQSDKILLGACWMNPFRMGLVELWRMLLFIHAALCAKSHHIYKGFTFKEWKKNHCNCDAVELGYRAHALHYLEHH